MYSNGKPRIIQLWPISSHDESRAAPKVSSVAAGSHRVAGQCRRLKQEVMRVSKA